MSLKKKREIENRNLRVTKRNRIKEESGATNTSTRNLSTRKRKLNAFVST